MNITQIKYFLMAAKCLNFTQAAEKLYITQPALSKQITQMEMELNMQLFIRSNRNVKLTPPGIVLQQEFEKIYNDYNLAVAKAANSFAGISGEINIGILDGADVGDLFPNVLRFFSEYYPQVKLNLRNYSFNALIEKIYSNELDFIITLLFDVKEKDHIQYRVIEKSKDYIAVRKDHRLAGEKFIKLADLKDDTFIMVAPEDSEESPRLILDACKTQGFFPKVKYASSLQEEMLWVEAGVGVCMLDGRNVLRSRNNIRFLETDTVSDPSLTLAWNVDNKKDLLEIFKNNFFGK